VAPIENRQAAARTQDSTGFSQNAVMAIQFMPDVGQEDEIDARVRQTGGARVAAQKLNVGWDARRGKLGAQPIQHFGLQVHGVQFAGGYSGGDRDGEVAGSGADIGGGLARLETKARKDFRWRKPLQPFRILQFRRVARSKSPLVQ